MRVSTVDGAGEPDGGVKPVSGASVHEKVNVTDGIGRLRIVVNNTLISLLGQAVTWISTLALTMAYGRYLGPSGFGQLYLAVTLTGLVGFPLEFGFNQQIIRDVAQTPERAHRYVSNALVLKIALWAPLIGVLLLVATLMHYSPLEQFLVALSGFTLLATSIGAAFGSMHYAVHRNLFPVVGSILEKGLDALIALAALRYFHVGVISIGFILLGGAIINSLWQSVWFYRLERPVFTFDRAIIREIIKTSVPFLMYGALGVIYYRIDTVILGAMDGDAVVGRYGAGYRIFDTLIFLPGLVMSTIMYPMMARLSKREPKAFQIAIEKSTNFLLICGLPLSTGFAVAAPAIVGFLYHHEAFARTVQVMEALAPGLVLLYMNTVVSNIIITTHREKALTIMAAVALAINVSLNFLLIPHFHEIAAAAVTSFTEFALLVMGLFAIPRDLIPLRSAPTLFKALAASVAMALSILALQHFTILVILPLAALTYAVAAAVLRLIPREDVRALTAALRKRSGSQTNPDTPTADVVVDLAQDDQGADAPPGTPRRPPRSEPLAELCAPHRAAERARLITRMGGRPTQPPARRARETSVSQPTRASQSSRRRKTGGPRKLARGASVAA